MKYCLTCGAGNDEMARFCIQCGKTTMAASLCHVCRTQNPDSALFCLQCGAPMNRATPATWQTGLLPANVLLGNRYVILRCVGKGGMGAVYQVGDTHINGKVWALKEMSDAAILNPTVQQQARAAFQHEAQMLALLDHPNLPKVNDFFTEGHKLYLVMDYIEGQTLQAMLEARPNPFPEAKVIEWADQLCDVLDYLHCCTPPVVFRDLKPGNIMLDRAGRIKLIDFGIARLFKPGQVKDTANYGTAGYAPPEQYGKGQTDARSDVYALGVTLHELLTRYDPALTPFVLPPVRKLNPAVSAHLEQAILKATQPAQADRFQRAIEFKAALTRAPRLIASQTKPQSSDSALPAGPAPSSASAVARVALPVPMLGRVITPSLPFEPEMIVISAGEFLMGRVDRTRKPDHQMYLDEYAIGKYPVTQSQYATFVQEAGYQVPYVDDDWAQPLNWDRKRLMPPDGMGDHPVVLVNWNDAVAYCYWLAQVTGNPYRLPTEAEWEKAARGTDGRSYPWGNETPDETRGNFQSSPWYTTEIGKYPAGASPYGVLDMAGNIYEWISDQSTGLSDYRIVMGGSWEFGAGGTSTRLSNSFGYAVSGVPLHHSFRCALS